MKIIFIVLLFVNILFGDTIKVYFYTTEVHINDFKSLKVSFDSYLGKHGDYEFQPFSDKETFEKYVKDKNSIVILSSWHYKKIAKEYDLDAKLVAQKKESTTDTKILVGQKNIPLQGVVTSAYDNEYTDELLNTFTKKATDKMSVLLVPKEIDALMSVSFGMSKFALVSRDSFEYLSKINPHLLDNLKIYNESEPKYRILLAQYKRDKEQYKLVSIFKDMCLNKSGKNVLKMIDIDKLVVLNLHDLRSLGGVK